MKKLIALYKAFRGGEWFQHSIDSIASVDGIVVVLSPRSWDNGPLENNCEDVVKRLSAERPGFVTICRITSERQEEQYAEGLKAIAKNYGDDVAVLVIDTDEVWTKDSLDRVRVAIDNNPQCHYFRSRLFTYLRSPLFQVYPQEAATTVVALQNAKPQKIVGRFRNRDGGKDHFVNGAVFYHFSYVREDESEIEAKFRAVSSQEDTASSPDWIERVWKSLPRGKNLHMTTGSEKCWEGIKILSELPCKAPPFCSSLVNATDDRWKAILESDSVSSTLIPTPNDADAAMYPEFASITPNVTMLRSRLKTTYLEAMILHNLACGLTANEKILEVGSGSGGSFAVMALASRANMWSVDPFSPYDETTHAGTVRGVREGNEAEFWETARHYGYVNRVRPIKLNSDEAAEHCPNEGFSIVFLDGNHSYNVIKSDIALFWPKVKPDGILLCHDFTTRFPGVIQAVNESGLDFSVYAGTSIAYCTK